MNILNISIVTLYILGLTLIFLYTLAQIHLAYKYLKYRDRRDTPDKEVKNHPVVTVQLPIFNEKYVVNRLIDAVSNFEWPKDKLEIQVLDDSTDETVDIIARKTKELQEKGIDIKHVRRDNRVGFKAGALEYGQKRAKGKYIAIFDADFIPKPNFLNKTIPHFDDDSVGMVQTRWGHINKDYSILTRMQAFALDAHFTVEQLGRNMSGLFMNFNGTAGVWRKKCINDAGGWQHDTITEDLDLSYRAQLKGWNFKYLEDVVSPAELPVAISALKTQQYRWTKGAAETARKNLIKVLKSDLPLRMKLHACSHLLNSSVFVLILLISLLSVPLLWVKDASTELTFVFKLTSFFILGLLMWVGFYASSLAKDDGTTWQKAKRITWMFPTFLTISMGFSYHNTIAVLKGFAGKISPFIRTPKFNITSISDNWKSNKYLISQLKGETFIEGFIALYFLGGIISAFILKDFALMPFHFMLFIGFFFISSYAVYEAHIKVN